MKKLRLSPTEREMFLSNVQNIVKKNTMEQLKDLSDYIPELDETTIKKPTIYIPAEIMLKMEALVTASPVEISWHGLVKRHSETNSYLIYDILVFPQINSSAATNTDQEEYGKWLTEIMNDEDENKFDNMRMHGHSHVWMNVFSSGIDDGYQTELLTNIKDGDYYIFMILNKKREMCVLLYDYNQQVMFETKDITINIVDSDRMSITKWATTQMEQYCRKPEPIVTQQDTYPWNRKSNNMNMRFNKKYNKKGRK